MFEQVKLYGGWIYILVLNYLTNYVEKGLLELHNWIPHLQLQWK